MTMRTLRRRAFAAAQCGHRPRQIERGVQLRAGALQPLAQPRFRRLALGLGVHADHGVAQPRQQPGAHQRALAATGWPAHQADAKALAIAGPFD